MSSLAHVGHNSNLKLQYGRRGVSGYARRAVRGSLYPPWVFQGNEGTLSMNSAAAQVPYAPENQYNGAYLSVQPLEFEGKWRF